MKKRLALILLMIVIAINDTPILAEETPQSYYILAYSTSSNKEFILPILYYNEEAYIEATLAASLAGMEYSVKEDAFVFSKRSYIIEIPQSSSTNHKNRPYLPMRETMDALHTTYIYNDQGQMVFIHCSSFPEDLKAEVCEIFQVTGDSPDFSLSYLENQWGIGLATVYNIISGLRVDYLWGGYQKEQYSAVIADLMINEKNDILELASDGNELLNDLITAGRLDGSLEQRDFLGYPYDDYLEAYDILNGSIPGLSVENGLHIIQNISTALHASELYANGIKYTLIDHPDLKGYLRDSSEQVYAYYDKNKSTLISILSEMSEDVFNGYLKDRSDVFIDHLGINTYWVKATELLFRKLGLNEKTTAAERTLICAEIQTISKKVVSSALSKTELSADDILKIKYGTVLYLRACQYAYSLYEFDEDLAWASRFWAEKTDERLARLASFDDNELISPVQNKALEMDLVSSELNTLLLQNKLNELAKDRVSTEPFLTSSGTELYTFPDSINGVINAVLLDIDNNAQNEIIAAVCENFDIIIKKYYIANDEIQETVLGTVSTLGYCNGIGIVLFYDPIFDGYCIAVNNICVRPYTGVKTFNSTLYSIHPNEVYQERTWEWVDLIDDWDRLGSIKNEMLSAGWPYMDNPYLSFYNEMSSDYIPLAGTAVETTGGFPTECKRYLHFLSPEELWDMEF